MAELALGASIISVVQLVDRCLQIGGKALGPSQHKSNDLNRISSMLYGLNGTIVGLQKHFHIHADDEVRFDALSHLKEPLKRCKEALILVEEQLKNTSLMGRYVVGARFDSKLKKAVDNLTESRTLFETALHVDSS